MGALDMLSRRSVLQGLPLAGASAAMVAIPAVGATLEGETPAFFAAIRALVVAIAEMDSAHDARASALAHYADIAPSTPEGLKARNSRELADGTFAIGCLAEREQNGAGEDIIENHRARYIGVSWLLQEEAQRFPLRSGKRLYLSALTALALEHEAAIASCRDACNLDAVLTRHYRAASEVMSRASALAKIEARTLVGLALKVEAYQAAALREPDTRHSIYMKGLLLENVAAVLGRAVA